MHLKELKMPKRLSADPDALTYNYGKFIAEPLSKGFGITLGNSLRRVLLSSLKGAAVTGAKIDGVLHEFSTIPGVVEDVTQIVLNLKEVRFRLLDDGPVTLNLDVKGMSEVTAADIQPNNRVEVMNPDQHIATLDKNGELKMEIYVDSGRGYVPAELIMEGNLQPGLMPIDASFSPVKKATFRVEDRREEMIDYDRLSIEVWTDGSMTAKDAVAEAANILSDYLAIFTDFDENYIEEEEEIDEEAEKRKMYLARPVAELELSVRSANCLEAAEIVTIRDLVTKTESEMLKFRNFGRKSLNEIKEILADMGLRFGMLLDEEGNEIEKEEEEPEDAS
ncbi:DNA-directed RNA polymerase subunit alpha [Candidatus Poribacteria bacterium]|nr:DNA-directed RNA polymerase subunit alpha [Candidatus Poribacteria bacterium]